MDVKQVRSCLIVTYGPVPTSEFQTVEGGGMRAWGLAKGLLQNGVDVTVGVNASFPQNLSEYESVRLLNWNLDDEFADVINSFDAIIISYCMGDPSIFVADRIKDDVQLILDAYVPIYVEVSARESKDIDTEYTNYMSDIKHFNKVLRRGDYFLCANEAQKTFYTGVFSALGIVNPRSYRDQRILVVPFGIHDTPAKSKLNPYKALGISDNDFVILWFGGLYPWFHIEELLGSMLDLSKHKDMKFVFVGGKNPFNPNPDFFKQYDKAVSFAEQNKLKNTSVFFVDWVDFDERVNWYAHANVVISLNRPGEENRYSWRTRVMDFVWGEVPIITNGGDPLSEDLIAQDAAIRLGSLTTKAIDESIEEYYNNQASLVKVKTAVTKLKPTYYWQTLTKPLTDAINSMALPFIDEYGYKKKLNLLKDETDIGAHPTPHEGKVRKAIRVPGKVMRHARKKGIKRSVKLAIGISKTQVKKYTTSNQQQKFVFISHPIDNTGAPLVLVQMVEEYAKKYGGKNVIVLAPGIAPHILRKLNLIGVRVEKAALGIGFRFIRLQLGLNKNDFVLMNTVAIYDNYRDFIFVWLKTGRLKHAYWFIHEDKDQLPVIHKEFLEQANIKQVSNLLASGKLSVLVPSKRTQNEYNEMFGTKKIRAINLRVDVDSKYRYPRKPNDYTKVNFLLQGTPSDGRKGHMLVLAAFEKFMSEYYIKNPGLYRDFNLHLVSIGDDYISQQIKIVGSAELGSRLHIYPSVPKEEVLKIYEKCNAVICASLNETFGLYVAEGMFMGHVVLRNNSAGVDEQLIEGKNGYFIDHTDISQFAATIEKVLNKEKVSDTKLYSMGQTSQEIIEKFSENSYIEQI